MLVKYLTMSCPDCNEELKVAIGCLNTPNNVFDVVELEHTAFHCEECNQDYYVGEVDIFKQ